MPRSTIFPDGAWHGLVARGLERVLRTVHATSEYRPRAEIEDNPDLQQIIPYCVVHHPATTPTCSTRSPAPIEREAPPSHVLARDRWPRQPGDGETSTTQSSAGSGASGRRSSGVPCRRERAWSRSSTTIRARCRASTWGWSSLSSPKAHYVEVREIEKLEGETLSLEARPRLPEHGVAGRSSRSRSTSSPAPRPASPGARGARRPRPGPVTSAAPGSPEYFLIFAKISPPGSKRTPGPARSGSGSGRRASSAPASPTGTRWTRRSAKAGSTV